MWMIIVDEEMPKSCADCFAYYPGSYENNSLCNLGAFNNDGFSRDRFDDDDKRRHPKCPLMRRRNEMNARQAAKAAGKRIEELEWFNKSAGATIRKLYQALDVIFSGGNVCELCEDYEECQLESKGQGKGCPEWSHKTPNTSELSEERFGPLEAELEKVVEGSLGGTDES